MNAEEQLFHEIGSAQKDAVKGQLFGKLCYKKGGKAFCCFFKDEMVFKLSNEAHAKALSMDGSQLFDPSGKNRPMKAWVQVPYVYKEMWPELAETAANEIP